MKRNLLSLLSGVAVATVVAVGVAAQNQNPPPVPVPMQAAKDVTLSGCVSQGSNPDTFLLSNAKATTDDPKAKGRVYVLAAGSEDLNIRREINHEVTVTGTSDGKNAPVVGSKYEEKDLPKFTAKSILMLADKCATPTTR